MERDERRLNPQYLLLQIQATLVERQTLLTGADTPAAQDRVNALGLSLAQLMDQVVEVRPPAALLENKATALGEFDRFLNRSYTQRRAA
ncbi:MAG: hypothetical protein AVDCRST_MAG77-1473 [uncultured Chloroflexi bacterium]|uniref:Uncharacterized protein n=1 Tax=uncultured Chloroflexota bacterium TaxID=166587 RepID=A0A6J4HY74_9CHLR|nr:MAG: hypothetical protein AVDCRST_MAG77-1473 [uncultured Chloroflexota bacterium]